jgi:GT2 family glycosyltransferase
VTDQALDVLIPTYRRPGALAVLLTSLAAQTRRDFRVVVSDQTEHGGAPATGEVRAAIRVLQARGHRVELHRHVPRRGVAEHRSSLLARVRAPYALFLDDDLILEPDVVERLVRHIEQERCGFVGCGLIGLSFVGDVRPDEERIEFWDGPVRPEEVRPGTSAWERHRLHNAANLHHVAQRLALPRGESRTYKVAWVGGCVLYDVAALREAGGFAFWRELPEDHAGEDVLAQLRVMARHGGCGIFPSGAYHQELPTTLADRRVDAPHALALHDAPRRARA